jgi:hypothetical protein
MESKANDLRAIQILYKALLVGQILFAAIALFVVESGRFTLHNAELGNILLIVAVILSVGGVAFSYSLFEKRMEIVKQQNDLSSKLEGYRAALIMQLGLSEFPALLAIIFYFITGNHAFLIIIILLLVNFLNLYPSRNKIVKQLELNSEEEAILE